MLNKFQEAAKSFIVRENFDEALDQALENKSDFNFAIDLKGSFYHGRTTPAEKPKERSQQVK